MEIKTDEMISTATHFQYDEYERKQLIIELAKGETLTIIVKDIKGEIIPESIKEYTAKFINCHFNMQWQDKGIKKEIKL